MTFRYCPECGEVTTEFSCPKDNTPTLRKNIKSGDREHEFIGRIIHNKYKIIDILGKGGMGIVFKAVQLFIERDVAIKILRREFVNDEQIVKRFLKEALTASTLTHPNTIRVFDFGETEDGYLFIVMEYLEGKPLSKIIKKRGALEPSRAVHIAIQILKSLGEAHAKGFIHRDLKPDNIFIKDIYGEKDFVKVMDFGIAKSIAAGGEESNLTLTGVLIGTPAYMSPEQARGERIDGRSDIYSLGIILYQMITGKVPFKSDSPMSTLWKHIHEPLPLIDYKKFNIPKELKTAIFKLLSKDRRQRPATAEEAIEMLSLIPLPKYEGKEEITPSLKEESLLPTICLHPHKKEEETVILSEKEDLTLPLISETKIIEKDEKIIASNTEVPISYDKTIILSEEEKKIPSSPCAETKIIEGAGKIIDLSPKVTAEIVREDELKTIKKIKISTSKFIIYFILIFAGLVIGAGIVFNYSKIVHLRFSASHPFVKKEPEIKKALIPQKNLIFQRKDNFYVAERVNRKELFTQNILNVWFKSLPPGADVSIDGKLIGKTPINIQVLKNQEINIEFKASGYKIEKKNFSFNKNSEVIIRLLKEKSFERKKKKEEKKHKEKALKIERW